VRWLEKLPSPGFVAIVLTNSALVAFLAWGFHTPKLHRVWELHHDLKIGTLGKLERGDYQLLDEAMTRHVELARGLLSDGEDIGLVSANSAGWLETPDATIIRTRAAGSSCVMVLDVKIPENALPLEIKVSGRHWERRVSLAKQGSTKLPLPELKGGAEIITLKVTSKDSRDEVATLGLRVGFECRGTKAEGGHD
jgi:hypothetical protein